MSSQTEMFDKGILEQDTTDDIILIDGVAYKDGVLIDSESMERGKLTWAVKAIKAVYKSYQLG
ncbi:hypothetical protein HCJ39_11925 [Listeria rocourtiae]|uniref:hypothetical protein n=1 Tax=Listeria rocourtiae TaxID=647910 RepID=UPI00162ACC73|nr:hypothetical protein [Listeria rocourtiae]MBC1605422.1 hypothetical protein [Listeria rocourtiae]